MSNAQNTEKQGLNAQLNTVPNAGQNYPVSAKNVDASNLFP